MSRVVYTVYFISFYLKPLLTQSERHVPLNFEITRVLFYIFIDKKNITYFLFKNVIRRAMEDKTIVHRHDTQMINGPVIAQIFLYNVYILSFFLFCHQNDYFPHEASLNWAVHTVKTRGVDHTDQI